MISIHGELTADESRIIVMAGAGDTYEVAQAARHLAYLTPLVKPTDPPGAVWVPATWPALVQLAELYRGMWRPGPRLHAWAADQVALRTGAVDPDGLDYVWPAGLTPYPWQIEAAQLIAATGHVLLTDEPGTGKTASAILGLMEWGVRHPYSLYDTFPVLVVCPASVVDVWLDEWQRWAPDVDVVAWRGSRRVRAGLAGTADVYVVSYDTARNDAPAGGRGPLTALAPAALVVDECHKIKNHQTVQSQAVRRLAADATNVVALSGTPITHHPGDLWPTLVALAPGAWPNRERWINRYCLTISGDYKETVVGLNPHTEPEFRVTLLGQHRRVAKADVLTQLPAKVYSTRTVDLPPAYRKAYDDMESDMLAELPDGGELSVMDALTQLTRLSQLACAAADVRVETEVDEQTGLERKHYRVTLKAPSWKVDALLEICEEREGSPVVVFAPSRQLINLAGEAAAKAGLSVGYVVGGQSMTERTSTVADFQAGKLDLLCATTQAGGVGLTLTAARTAVFLMRPWSLVDSIQAEDRIHRIGSERHESVEIIDVIARNTIDTRVRAVLRDKAGQLSELVQDPRIVTELLGGSGVKTLTRKEAS